MKPRAKAATTHTRRIAAITNQNHLTVVTTDTDARYSEMTDRTAVWAGRVREGRLE